MSDRINRTNQMIDGVTVLDIIANCNIEVQATSGTVTVQYSIDYGLSYANATPAIPSGGIMFFSQKAPQGSKIKVSGGNANIKQWRE